MAINNPHPRTSPTYRCARTAPPIDLRRRAPATRTRSNRFSSCMTSWTASAAAQAIAMRAIGMPVHKRTRAGRKRVIDLVGAQHGADRLISTGEPLGERHDIRHYSMLLAGEKRSGAPRTTHDFVENQQHVMPVADLTNAPQIARRRCHRARRRTTTVSAMKAMTVSGPTLRSSASKASAASRPYSSAVCPSRA